MSRELNWKGEPYKNERKTRPLKYPNIPPKTYLDHTNYMRFWRVERSKLKTK